jgi:hypothetical protein
MKGILYAGLLATQCVWAQPGAIMITSETGDIFRVAINNRPPSDCFQERFYLDDLMQGNYRLTVDVYNGPGRLTTLYQDVMLPARSEADVRLVRDQFGRLSLPVTMRPRGGPVTLPGIPRPGDPTIPSPPPNNPPPSPMPGYNGPVGCPNPVAAEVVGSFLATIRRATFENDKLITAKQFLSSNCVFARDVLEIVRAMSFESSRLEIAKFAFASTFDQGNYFVVNDGFTFSSSVQELNDFILNSR